LVCAKRLWQVVIVVAEQSEAYLILNSWFVHEVCSMYQFVGSAFQVRDIVMHPETGQSLVSLHARVMWSPLQKHFMHHWRIHLGFTMLTTMCF
jgi:hypothetical protein